MSQQQFYETVEREPEYSAVCDLWVQQAAPSHLLRQAINILKGTRTRLHYLNHSTHEIDYFLKIAERKGFLDNENL